MLYVVSVTPDFPSKDTAMSMVAEERAKLGALIASKRIVTGFLAEDWSKVWLMCEASDAAGAEATVRELPMARYFRFDAVTAALPIGPMPA